MNQQLPVPAPSAIAQLSQRQKAAIIVKLLVGGGVSLDDLELDADAIWKITNAMTGLGVVGKDIVDAVTAEFILEMERMGLVFERDIDGSLKAMEDQITAETLRKVKARQSGSAESNAWTYIAKTDAEVLALRIAAENPRVGAVILSKLAPSKSAEIVGHIAPEAAEAILAAISKTTAVKPEIVNRIGIALADSLQDKGGAGAFEDSAAARIGAILNMSASQFRDEFLGRIEQKDPETATQIRRLMFTFEDIPSRIIGRDVSKILRGVDDETLVMALSGAATQAPEVKTFILANISSRLAEQIEESIQERGAVKAKDADAAMTQVVIAIKELEKAGEITLIEPEEEEEA
jgi:flagellar motor switch protein FliG